MKSVNRRSIMHLGAGAAAGALLSGCATSGGGQAPAPGIRVATFGRRLPIGGALGEPFRGVNTQPVPGPGLPLPALVQHDYVEEEYVVSGEVSGRAYATAMLVRRPRDAARFSGSVAYETLHVQGAIPFWRSSEEIMSRGHAWVLIVSQRGALESQLKPFNAARYGDLDIPDAEAATLGDGPQAPSGRRAGGPNDLFSQAIMTQVAAMLKSSGGPFPPGAVRKILLSGSSQTGGTTISYIRHSHDGARLADGRPLIDAYAPQLATAPAALPAVDAPILHFYTENEVMRLASGQAIEPNASPLYRVYEVPGGAHIDTHGVDDPGRVMGGMARLIAGEQASQFPTEDVFDAFMRLFFDWVESGEAPPPSSRIDIANGAIVRDEYGNARGGVRTPYVDVPTARYIASAPQASDAGPMRALIGLQEPLPAAELRRLYRSKAEYFQRFDAAMDQVVARKFMLAENAARLKQDERGNPILAALP